MALLDRHAVEKCFEATPSRTLENAISAKENIVLFIIDLQAKEEKLVVDKTDTLYANLVNYWESNAPCPQCLQAWSPKCK